MKGVCVTRNLMAMIFIGWLYLTLTGSIHKYILHKYNDASLYKHRRDFILRNSIQFHSLFRAVSLFSIEFII